MKFFKQGITVLALAAALAPAAAFAQDGGVKVTIGVKAWVHNWSTWFNCTGGVCSSETGNETAIIPSVAVRFGNFFVAGDYTPEVEYKFVGETGTVKKDEWSVIGGYYLVPQLAIAGGFKRQHQDFRGLGINFDVNIDIVMLGLQGGAALGDGGWFMYGNGFFGPGSVSSVQTGNATNDEVFYYSTELGLGYRFTDHLAVTGGFKYQTLRWEDVSGTAGGGIPGNDLTNGWIFGLSFTF
jgi:hypothetical protein